MRKHTYQYFSLDEYQERLDALRAGMEEKGVDVMLINTPENLFYITGYQTPGYYWFQTLIVPMDREPVFITRRGESANVEPLTWVEDSRPYDDNDDWIAKTKDALVDLGFEGKRIGIEKRSWFITIEDFERLSAALPSATFVNCYGLVEQGRMIKSPQEIAYMRQAARAAEAGMLAAIESSAVGATENDVAAEIHRAQILAGSEYTGLPIFVASGSRSQMGHPTWYRKRLEPNESIKFEIPACINRYHAAIFRPVYLGDPPKKLVRSAEVVTSTLKLAEDFIKPGVTVGDVHDLVQENLMGNLGVPRNLSRVGYSIGIAFAPDWGEGHIISFFKDDPKPLQVGMTFHLIVVARSPGVDPMYCSDTILVTEDGCETLTNGVEQKLYAKSPFPVL